MVSLWNMKFSLLYLFEFIQLLLDTKEYTTLAFQLLLHLLPNKAAEGIDFLHPKRGRHCFILST